MKKIKLSEQTIFVPKILSYQTLVYKNGSSTFKKKKYHEYANLIDSQMTKFYSDKPLRVKVNFIFKVPKTYSKKRKFETYGQLKLRLKNLTQNTQKMEKLKQLKEKVSN